jgi:hypothetical protein
MLALHVGGVLVAVGLARLGSVVGVAALVVITVLRRAAPRVPALLIATAGASRPRWALSLDDPPVVRTLPYGFSAAAWGSLTSICRGLGAPATPA